MYFEKTLEKASNNFVIVISIYGHFLSVKQIFVHKIKQHV